MQTEVNKTFVIRYKMSGSNMTFLVGAGQYHNLVGPELKDKHFNKVLNGEQDKYTFKLRRGLTVNFCPK